MTKYSKYFLNLTSAYIKMKKNSTFVEGDAIRPYIPMANCSTISGEISLRFYLCTQSSLTSFFSWAFHLFLIFDLLISWSFCLEDSF